MQLKQNVLERKHNKNKFQYLEIKDFRSDKRTY